MAKVLTVVDDHEETVIIQLPREELARVYGLPPAMLVSPGDEIRPETPRGLMEQLRRGVTRLERVLDVLERETG